MQIDRINSYNTTFGMALYMPSQQKIEKSVGKMLANQAEKARPKLERLAQNIDITVTPKPHHDLALKGFDIVVSQPKAEIKNPLKRLFGKRPYVDYTVANFETTANPMSELLVRKTEGLISQFNRYGAGN